MIVTEKPKQHYSDAVLLSFAGVEQPKRKDISHLDLKNPVIRFRGSQKVVARGGYLKHQTKGAHV